jgi:hypothetical protein
MLLCASVAALAFGVLSAHVICRAAFSLLRLHARAVAEENALKAKPSTAAA